MSSKRNRIILLAFVLAAVVAAVSATAFAQTPTTNPVMIGAPVPAPTTKPAPLPRDDYQQLQRLLNKGGKIEISPGLYQVSQTLRPVSNSIIVGTDVTIRAFPNQSTLAASADTMRLVGLTNVKIAGIHFDGNISARGHVAQDSSQASIGAWGGSDIEVTDCTFTGAVCDDIFVGSSKGPYAPVTDLTTVPQWVTLRNNKHSTSYRQMLSVVHCRHGRVIGNSFRDQTSPFTGVSVDVEANPGDMAGVLSDITIAGNTFSNCNQGVNINGVASPANVQVCGNRFTDGLRGVLNLAPGTLIKDNAFARLKSIAVVNNALARIVGNDFAGCLSVVVYFNPGTGASVVAYNTIADCGEPAGTQSPWVIQTRFGGGHEIVTGNVVSFTTPRPDMIAYLTETGTAQCSGNVASGCAMDGVAK